MQHKRPSFSGNASKDAAEAAKKFICQPKKHESSDNTVVAVIVHELSALCSLRLAMVAGKSLGSAITCATLYPEFRRVFVCYW
jgi:hypothetical protein